MTPCTNIYNNRNPTKVISSCMINTIVFTGIVAFAYFTDDNESVISDLYPVFQPYKPLSIDRV